MSNVLLAVNGVVCRIGRKIGEGSFGVVFEGEMLLKEGKVPVAIKFESSQTKYPQLQDEFRTYKDLQRCKGIPRVHYFDKGDIHNILITDLLGPSLENLFDKYCRRSSGGTVSLRKTVGFLAEELLLRFQGIHEQGWIYCDVKPENFLIGIPGTPVADTIHVVDFGMAKQYRDPRTERHIPFREDMPLSGTARYMSINTHLGRERSRRDDLEALGHVFLYFLKGRLPWQGTKAATNGRKYEKIAAKKQEISIEVLCVGCPPEVAKYMEYVRSLGFEDEPNYEYLRGLWSRVRKNSGDPRHR
ncbi:kinase-like domain-containing protein [Cercophora newfieldiana]|uniref:Kinase-like domain-containing protein n=1 Tax=Cercophora newfieldiana TaxID=92897 RepID=A0AA40CIP3_9PEZI|nr:kinase-like domain-containing protein [Cercophora newfieldiana]